MQHSNILYLYKFIILIIIWSSQESCHHPDSSALTSIIRQTEKLKTKFLIHLEIWNALKTRFIVPNMT